MKILNITAQKLDATGSGVFLAELMKQFDVIGIEQALIAGVYKEDIIKLPEKIEFFPVYFNCNKLPFAIVGMSDVMPYESTIYSEMTKCMKDQYEKEFSNQIKMAVEKFKPDVILCNHLYWLTSMVRESNKNIKVVGICHGTDIRQLKKHKLKHDFIKEHIKNLDIIMALHEEQKRDIIMNYGVTANKIEVVGTGYNKDIFFRQDNKKRGKQIKVVYAGKLARAKGVISLMKSLDHLSLNTTDILLRLAGGYGDEEEYSELCELVSKSKYQTEILGKLEQKQLARVFRECDIFILPSFYEGLPLVIMEALACGLRVIVTDIPGIRTWMNHNIPQNNIHYISLPAIQNIDEPIEQELVPYEKRLAKAIETTILEIKEQAFPDNCMDMEHLSWEGVSKKIVGLMEIKGT